MEIEKIREIICSVVNVQPNKITREASILRDLKMDSLDVYRLFAVLEDKYDIILDDVDPRNIITIGDVVDYVENRKGKGEAIQIN